MLQTHQQSHRPPVDRSTQLGFESEDHLVRREIVHVLRALVSQARSMLSLARRGEAVRRPADRATRESEGPASSGEPDKHRGRRHRLPALLLASWVAAMVAKVGGVFGTLTYPHLIRPYSGYYGHLASHYGGPWRPPYPVCAIGRVYGYLSRLSIKKW